LFKRFQNPIDECIKREAHVWIDASLVERDLLATRSAKKQTAMPADLTKLRQALFQVEYLATFTDCRAPLQFALFLVLIVDCSGRAGELVAPSNTKTDNNKHLKWSRVSLYAFPTPAGVTIRANIAWEDLKDPKPPSNRQKIIPLRLLPLSLAGEDSPRMLLILAFIDGEFENLNSWDDIQTLHPGPDGAEILLKPSALKLPASLLAPASPPPNRRCRF
jgi:hypothetical protein